jgi:hypothetical protein
MIPMLILKRESGKPRSVYAFVKLIMQFVLTPCYEKRNRAFADGNESQKSRLGTVQLITPMSPALRAYS